MGCLSMVMICEKPEIDPLDQSHDVRDATLDTSQAADLHASEGSVVRNLLPYHQNPFTPIQSYEKTDSRMDVKTNTKTYHLHLEPSTETDPPVPEWRKDSFTNRFKWQEWHYKIGQDSAIMDSDDDEDLRQLAVVDIPYRPLPPSVITAESSQHVQDMSNSRAANTFIFKSVGRQKWAAAQAAGAVSTDPGSYRL